jgi:hypothetical protein
MALPQSTVDLPITCVEGWSATGRWTGVRLVDLVTLVGGPVPGPAIVTALQRGGYGASIVDADHAADPLTLIALRLIGEPLHPDHGYPARLIAPNPPWRPADEMDHGHPGDHIVTATRLTLGAIGLAAIGYAVSGLLTDDGCISLECLRFWWVSRLRTTWSSCRSRSASAPW